VSRRSKEGRHGIESQEIVVSNIIDHRDRVHRRIIAASSRPNEPKAYLTTLSIAAPRRTFIGQTVGWYRLDRRGYRRDRRR
jgi:hypothetical protein